MSIEKVKKVAGALSEEEAQLYCAVHDGAPGDVEFYVEAARGAARVLELGAGNARVALAIAERGITITALERDPGMLALARARRDAADDEVAARLTIAEGDMTSFALDERFDRVIIPFTGIYCLLDEADLDACLARVAAHLTDDGQLLFDAYAADGFHEEARPEDYPDDQLEEVALIGRGDDTLTVFERSRWDREAQRMDAIYVYLDDSERVVAELEVGHRYLLSSQVEPALARAGLRLEARYGGFDRSPFGPGSGSMVIVARRAR